VESFCDDRSPLPRVFRPEAPRRTATGAPFPDFYFGGAKLMRAFADLGAPREGRPPAAATR
jgi:hypothetical protein